MKLFIDTANVEEIRRANDLGVICGVTTNPSLIAKEGRDFVEVVKEITDIVDGPISAEVISMEAGAVPHHRQRKPCYQDPHVCRRIEGHQASYRYGNQDERHPDLLHGPGAPGR